MEKIKELNKTELEQVNGGGVCISLGAGIDLSICLSSGASVVDSMDNENTTQGYGMYACFLIGTGWGYVTNEKFIENLSK